MARYTGPSCRQCRREGTKLFLKGSKCFTEKCPVERRPYAPGQHGQSTARRKKVSEYAKQLREKQKVKRVYGMSERQFRNTFEKVATQPQLIRHRHIEVKGQLVDVPSYAVAPGEEVRVKQGSRELAIIAASLELAARGTTPTWLAVDKESFSGRLLEKPTRDRIALAAQEQLVVELYSK
ncbi:MAG: 30S ribosomal protein S4 [Gemmatimonadaceae bacterium]|nr:30S ribosomal protein S4 [Gemmatimonadaceae bacterium]